MPFTIENDPVPKSEEANLLPSKSRNLSDDLHTGVEDASQLVELGRRAIPHEVYFTFNTVAKLLQYGHFLYAELYTNFKAHDVSENEYTGSRCTITNQVEGNHDEVGDFLLALLVIPIIAVVANLNLSAFEKGSIFFITYGRTDNWGWHG